MCNRLQASSVYLVLGQDQRKLCHDKIGSGHLQPVAIPNPSPRPIPYVWHPHSYSITCTPVMPPTCNLLYL
jgi:hypothetical protein